MRRMIKGLANWWFGQEEKTRKPENQKAKNQKNQTPEKPNTSLRR